MSTLGPPWRTRRQALGALRPRQNPNGEKHQALSGPPLDGQPRSGRRSELLGEVFDLLPSGIVLASRAGRLIVWNKSFEEMSGMDGKLRARTCCELFGCRADGGPLAGACLSELAVSLGTRTPELRLELRGAPGRAFWVAASPLYKGSAGVVFQVRPATREADAPERAQVPRLRIFLLGPTRVETPEGPLGGDWLNQRAGQLLKYLACERHRIVPTEEIAEAIWPNPHPMTPNTVRHFIHALREKLEPERPKHDRSSLVLAHRGGYRLDGDRVWVDADEFESGVRAGLAAFAEGETGAATQKLEHALSLYRGHFLADEPYAEWALNERERLRSLAESSLRALAELSADDIGAATGYLEWLAEMLPFDSEIHRRLLELWVEQGYRSKAVRHYHAFQLRLLREFGEQPSFSLSELVASRSRRG